jgi:hypothetical protein
MTSKTVKLNRELKRQKILSEMVNYTSFVEWGKATGVTMQAIERNIKYYGLKNEWEKHCEKTLYNFDEVIFKKPGIAKFIFDEIKEVYFISSKKNIRFNILYFIRDIKLNKRYGYLKQYLKSYKLQVFYLNNDLNKIKRQMMDQVKYWNFYKCFNPLPKGTMTQKDIYNNIEQLVKKNYSHLPRPKSPYPGMTWCWRSQSWKLQPFINGKQTYIGYEKDVNKAIEKIKSICG